MAPSTVEGLFSKLHSHWTPIAHHLYLKHECPSPLPRVGPLAELLNVTRYVCTELNSLIANGEVTADSITSAVASSGQQKPIVRLLGKLVGWLQHNPQEELLLNFETQESLWQLLLITLANMLRVVEEDQPSSTVAVSIRQELIASGLFDSLIPALQWVQVQYPRRCITATAGAWLLLQEAFSSNLSNLEVPATSEAVADKCPASAAYISRLGPVLQACIDQGYATLQERNVPASPKTLKGAPSRKQHSTQDSSSSSSAGGSSSGGGSSSSIVNDDTEGLNGISHATAVVAAVSEDGSWRLSHPICLMDDPSSPAFGSVMAVLHVLQWKMLQIVAAAATAAATAAAAGGGGGATRAVADISGVVANTAAAAASDQQQQQQQQCVGLPGKAFLQLVALSTTALYQQVAAAAGSSSSSIPPDHSDVLPCKEITVAADQMLQMTTAAAAARHLKFCCQAFQTCCFILPSHSSSDVKPSPSSSSSSSSSSNDVKTIPSSSSSSDVKPSPSSSSAVKPSPSSSSSSSDPKPSPSSSSDDIDSVASFKLLLESILLLQQCGEGRGLLLLLDLLLLAARACSRLETQQLIAARGHLLLQVLADYLTHQQQQQPDGSGSNDQQQQQQQQYDTDGLDDDNAERCVICAEVLIQMCPGRLAAAAARNGPAAAAEGGLFGHQGLVDDELLGSLTEQDPMRFYSIMDHLVRHVEPQNLQVLLPMSPSFLTQSMVHAKAGSSSSSSSSRANRSMVILSDTSVCRSFAAAVNGYSKSVVGPVLSSAGKQQQQQHGNSAAAVAAASGSSCGSCDHDHHHHDHCDHNQCNHNYNCCDHDHHHDHDRDHDHDHDYNHECDLPISLVLPPLQQTAEWLAASLEQLIISVVDASEALDHSSSSSSSSSRSSKQQRDLAAADLVQIADAASTAAACGLVLITLLARAAVTVLQDLQSEVQQLVPAAAAAASTTAAASAAGEVYLLQEETAVNMLTGLMFSRAAYQALCCRCYLSQVLDQLPAKISDRSAAGNGGSSSSSSNSNGVAAAPRGDNLPIGWSHLAQAVPTKVLSRVQAFQSRWPGDFVASLQLLQEMQPVQSPKPDKNPDLTTNGSSSPAAAAAVVHPMLQLPASVKLQIDVLLTDLQELLEVLLREVPLPVGCNNPACINLEGVAEASLSVNKRCKECLACHYCSRECQTAHWKQHKSACKRLRSATAGPRLMVQ